MKAETLLKLISDHKGSLNAGDLWMLTEIIEEEGLQFSTQENPVHGEILAQSFAEDNHHSENHHALANLAMAVGQEFQKHLSA